MLPSPVHLTVLTAVRMRLILSCAQLFKRQLTDLLGGAGSALAASSQVPIVLAASAGSQLVSALCVTVISLTVVTQSDAGGALAASDITYRSFWVEPSDFKRKDVPKS